MKQLSKVHSDEKSLVGNCLSFQKITGNFFSLKGNILKNLIKVNPFIKITIFKTLYWWASYLEICNMHEAVQLHYIRNGLNCVIEQFSIYVFKCCTRATTPKLLENRLNGQNSTIS